jgi:hypothetical protein
MELKIYETCGRKKKPGESRNGGPSQVQSPKA